MWVGRVPSSGSKNMEGGDSSNRFCHWRDKGCFLATETVASSLASVYECVSLSLTIFHWLHTFRSIIRVDCDSWRTYVLLWDYGHVRWIDCKRLVLRRPSWRRSKRAVCTNALTRVPTIVYEGVIVTQAVAQWCRYWVIKRLIGQGLCT